MVRWNIYSIFARRKKSTGCSAVRLARQLRELEAPGSNPGIPTEFSNIKRRTNDLCRLSVRSFVCLSVCLFGRLSARLLVEGSPRSPLALQQRNVILSGAKDLLNDNTLCAWSLVGFYRFCGVIWVGSVLAFYPIPIDPIEPIDPSLHITNYTLFTMN